MNTWGSSRYGVVVCLVVQWTFVNKMKHIINEDIKKQGAKNWALGYSFVFYFTPMTSASFNFDSLMSIWTWPEKFYVGTWVLFQTGSHVRTKNTRYPRLNITAGTAFVLFLHWDRNAICNDVPVRRGAILIDIELNHNKSKLYCP